MSLRERVKKPTCFFYVLTARGRRCVLMDLKNWFKRSGLLTQAYCLSGGTGCPILEKVKRVTTKRK